MLSRLKLTRWAFAISLTALSLPASAAEKIALTLASSIDSRSAPVFLAIDKGYFAAEGIDVDVAPGNGSANTVTRVASGAFQIGIGDVASLIKFNVTNPTKRVKAIYNFYMADLAIVTLKGKGISSPADLKGRKIGAPTGDTAYRMFSAFGAATGLKSSDVVFEHMNLSVREVMLAQGKVDAITATAVSALSSLKAAGVKPEDMIFMRYADYGVSIVGNGLMTTEALIKSKPALLTGFVRALNRGWMDTLKDPEAGLASVLKREPLLKRDIELEKLLDIIRNFSVHADAAKTGLGSYGVETLAASIDIIAAAEQLSAKPSPDEIADMSMLPPIDQRRAPAVAR